MGYSESAMAGVKQNGRAWKATIKGIPEILSGIEKYVEDKDVQEIDFRLRMIGKKFRYVWKEDEASFGENETLEWFEEESCSYDAENGTLEEWQEEFNDRLDELYDWADFNRVWIEPF